ncbi:MAG: tail fiber domain-containing protein, partial [Pseudomonadota bacterium]
GPAGPEGASPLTAEEDGTLSYLTADVQFRLDGQYSQPAVVIGSRSNSASGSGAVVIGGQDNSATAEGAVVGGGRGNSIYRLDGRGDANSGEFAVIGGGQANEVTGMFSTIGGGWSNRASNFQSTVGGGLFNNAAGQGSVVGGGWSNYASDNSVVSGGNRNVAGGSHATVSGGHLNAALGDHATVAGGDENCAGSAFSWAAGRRAKVRRSSESTLGGSCDEDVPVGDDRGTFIWADSTFEDFISSGPNQFLIRSAGGVGINTNAPRSELHVRGPSPDSIFGGQLRIESSEEDGSEESGGAVSFQGHDGSIPRVWGVIRSVKENNTVGNTDSVMRFYTRSFATSLRETMRIDSDGNVYNSSGSWSVLSDERLKEDIEPLDGALDRLLALEGVTFRYRSSESELMADGQRTGFLAQQVETVMPEWVGENADGVKFISPSGFEAMTVEALRELAERQDTLINNLQTRLENQQRQLVRLEVQLRALAGVRDPALDSSQAATGETP